MPLVGDLDQPRHLACDQAGNVYVSLQGTTRQVWSWSVSFPWTAGVLAKRTYPPRCLGAAGNP